jgi:ribose/xylose/arabinose/galactoside ABC-type transport system permease subunit
LSIHPLTWLGIFLILLGVALVILQAVGRYIDLSKVPPWLIYIYHSDGFYFVTSPLLILLSAVALIFFLLKHST